MIKTIALLTRKDGLTREQFVAHWRDVHAPLARAVPYCAEPEIRHLSGSGSKRISGSKAH